MTNNWLDGSWLQAKTSNADFNAATDYLMDNSNDYKWSVAQAGLYKITVDLAMGRLTVKRMDYEYMTLVGPGSPSGNWTKPEGDLTTDFTITAPGSNIWTFTGVLNVGEVKVHAKIGSDFIVNNWEDGNWLYSDAVNADFLTAAKYRIDGTDTKWNIAEAGLYNITINLAGELLTVQKMDDNGMTLQKNSLYNKSAPLDNKEVPAVKSDVVVYPNPTSGLFSIQISRPKSAKATVYILNLNGRILQQRNVVFSEETQSFKFNVTGAASGIYLIKVTGIEGVTTQNLILQN